MHEDSSIMASVIIFSIAGFVCFGGCKDSKDGKYSSFISSRSYKGHEIDLDSPSVAIILQDLLAMPGIQPLDEIDWGLVLELWPQQVGDFADAGLTAVLRSGGYDSLATFDLSFSKAVRKQGLPLFW